VSQQVTRNIITVATSLCMSSPPHFHPCSLLCLHTRLHQCLQLCSGAPGPLASALSVRPTRLGQLGSAHSARPPRIGPMKRPTSDRHTLPDPRGTPRSAQLGSVDSSTSAPPTRHSPLGSVHSTRPTPLGPPRLGTRLGSALGCALGLATSARPPRLGPRFDVLSLAPSALG